MATSTEDEFVTERPDSPINSGVSLKSDRSMGKLVNFTHDEPSEFVTERPDSPINSGVSLKSDRSMGKLINFTHDEQSQSVTERPDSPINSGVSLKSDRSMGKLINFTHDEQSQSVTERPDSPINSGVSLKSDRSMGKLVNFTNNEPSQFVTERPDSPINSGVSLKSDRSMGKLINFTHDEQSQSVTERPDSPINSGVSLKSDRSMGKLINFTNNEPRKGSGSSAASSASMASDRSMGKPINKDDQPSSFQSRCQMRTDDPLNFNSNPEEYETNDQHNTLTPLLKKRILRMYGDESKTKSNTDLFEIKADKNKNKQLKNYNEIFELRNEMRTVLTKGVDGIGKTFKTKQMMVDWAKGKSNKHIDLIVTLHFSDLNSRRNKVQSMEDLLNIFFDIEQHTVPIHHAFKIAFVLDGLEKCELDLDFKKEDLTDIKEQASIDVLLTSLIKGKLLPSARLWIITQPSGVDKIPPEYIHKVTECRETSERRKQLISKLRERYSRENAQTRDETHPNQENIEHIIRENSAGEVEDKNGKTLPRSVTRVNKIPDIFNDEKKKKIKKVLTIKQLDIGKTFYVEKFIEEWTKEKSWFDFGLKYFKDDEILFALNLSQLNSIKDKTLSLRELINHFFKETKESVISDYESFKVIFLLDGLDSCQLPLNFKSDMIEDVTKRAPVGVLLTNLIQGNLFPSAKLWLISGPSSLKGLPDGIFDRTTEIREKPDVASQRKLKSQLKEKYTWVGEGIDQQKTSALLNNIYTPLYIITGERGEVNVQHETRQVQEAKFKPVKEEINIECHEIFKPACGENIPIRTALTLGVAGIGKSFASMKFILDWAEGGVNNNINFIFPLPFRELNLMKGGEYSFEELIHQFFPIMKTSEITNYDKYQILIVLDGLDECRCDLNFSESIHLADVKKESTVNVLLANLIKGNLLPKAQIWITSRPAASNNIPADKVQRVTEVRGFNDEHKQEYFKKRFDKDFEGIFSHIKTSRSLFIMCHIPVFCWITAKVLEDCVQRHPEEEMPKTLTDMYIRFLLLQCRQANVKYEKDKTDSCWNERNKETILSLAQLAFEETEKGNFLFTQEDLPGHVDVKSAIFSGLFTQVKRECSVLQKDFFCFVHLSIQEFLAALHVFYTFKNSGENLLSKQASADAAFSASDFYKTAVDKALDSQNGDWDLFLRFLLGLSQENNQDLLYGLLEKSKNNETNEEIIDYIKGKISEEIKDSDKNLNLFHCLIELNDHSLVNEVRKYLQSETLPFEKFSASQWSALNFVLLMSDENLDVFDLKKYQKSEKVLLEMLPVVKVAKTALLSWCELSEESCKGLTSSVLSSSSSNLTKLDLNHNDLLDSGVELLAKGLGSLHCLLETVNLAGCQVTEKGCSAIASALNSNIHSHLKQLDLSYNHPGDNGSKMLTDIKDDPKKKLNTLCLDHGGIHRLKPGLKKYGVDLVFDINTANRRLSVLGKNVKTSEDVWERDSGTLKQDKSKWTNMFCDGSEMLNKGLTGLCYWEVEWAGRVGIAVAYEKVGRQLDKRGGLGCNDISWSLDCSATGYTAKSGNKTVPIQSEVCQKIAVFLDWDGGRLSYYSVTPAKLSHIHTFYAKFTKPLFPGFWFKKGSVTLCNIE
ncbi:hypothetical protein JOB18_045074 [Solea senegalensis]|uniref:Uncharacterized protein n=1 Tax=Solea senegalensis TaxID=28829 RepID=A0AAV6SXM7_SOLSE|nr:hypothetical protein JOB18_045074 [Solea senegalensis]KAG7521262.1 hypothetical protein JOB18_045074 [Solea senegalensis]